MLHRNHLNKQAVRLFGTLVGGSLIGLSGIPLAASAAPTSLLNPCPGIYYEEPFNNTHLVPQGCPPNAATQRLSEGQAPNQQTNVITPSRTRIPRAQPPLPETIENAIATITPMDGKVDVKLQNNTNTRITCQAIGYTDSRSLAGREEIVLQDLPTPVTITVVRQDGGLLKATPMPASTPGILAVSLDETTTLSDNQGVLRIQSDGQVFLN